MYNIVLLVAAILLSYTCHAQKYLYNLHFTLSTRNFADTVHIEIGKGRVYVPVTVGKQRYKFLLDTGASMGGLYKDTKMRGIKPAGEILSYDANGQTNTTPVVSLPPIRIGKVTINEYHANLLNRPHGAKGADGIIGFDLFNKGIIGKIDVRRGIMILTDRKRHFASEKGYKVNYRLYRHVPYIRMSSFGQYSEEVRFDTGDLTSQT